MIKHSIKALCLSLSIVSISLTGCSSQPVTGTEAVLVPVKTELKLGYKSNQGSQTQKVNDKARDFIVTQFEANAEQIEVIAYSAKGQQLQAKLQSQLGKYRPWMSYKTERKTNSVHDVLIRAKRTQVIMPPCQALGSHNAWTMQDDCFVGRARNKSLATPSTLKPVVSELSIAEEK
ncbi:hypothetical protein [Vibrio europaeus]|uniref:hypothetical protein n=1 Tax=Vibrio europaeus TaxID=300876 RepID=UPI00148E6DDA|nr:hypothetical protein [Vibrio europaeus]NOH21843.1 hypothetical protein [Vibrio europaeus]